jgi:syntaxin 1B/2/3
LTPSIPLPGAVRGRGSHTSAHPSLAPHIPALVACFIPDSEPTLLTLPLLLSPRAVLLPRADVPQTSTDAQAAAYASQLNDQARAQREACKNQIKKLFKLAKGDRAMKNQVEAVKTRFTSLLNEHQVIEKEFRKKVKDRVERQYRIVNPQASEEEVRQVTESDNPQVFSQAVSD